MPRRSKLQSGESLFQATMVQLCNADFTSFPCRVQRRKRLEYLCASLRPSYQAHAARPWLQLAAMDAPGPRR